MASAAHWQKSEACIKWGGAEFLHDDSNEGGLDVRFGFMSLSLFPLSFATSLI